MRYIEKIQNAEIVPMVEEFINARTKASAIPNTTAVSPVIVKNNKYAVMPAFCDVHVHFREPGFSYKATVKSESPAAAHGGYTTVCTMPNLKPVPDSIEHLKEQLDIIESDSVTETLPYGAITVGELGHELADLDGMAPYVCAFSDDGRGVQNEEMMRTAMKRAKALNKIIAAHCEDNSLLFGGYIHAGEYAKAHGHRGILSESEYGQIARDIKLAKEVGVKYHVCHISTKESVELIRKAKADGVDITCETAPHYLIMSDRDLREDGRFKMNPPLRDESDRLALLEGIIDGTIDMIATDHAPHSAEEKSRGLEKSAFGVVGLESSFALLYTHLVRTGIITLEKLVHLMSIAPRERFGIPIRANDLTVFEIATEYEIDPRDFLSMGRATPLEGDKVYGSCILTVKDNKIIYHK